MKELMRTSDPTQIAYATALLEGEGIKPFVLDVHMSVLEGSIGILPRRLMVHELDYQEAYQTLLDNDLPVKDDT